MKQQNIKCIAEDYLEAKKNCDSLIMEKVKKEYLGSIIKKEKYRIERRKKLKSGILPVIVKITAIMTNIVLVMLLATFFLIGFEALTGTTPMNFINEVINSNAITQYYVILLLIIVVGLIVFIVWFIIVDNIKAFKEMVKGIKESKETDEKIIDFLIDCEEQ